MTENGVGAAVVLIGAPGAGKTRTGKRLARILNVPFIDTDKRIVAQHGVIAEIFSEHGESHFRSLEREVVAEALFEHAVVTLGGGAVLDPRTQADLAQYPVVQLTVSAGAVEARISGGKRPLLTGGVAAWQALVDSRQPLYDRLSDFTIDTSSQPLDRVAQKIAHWLERQHS
ncbi:shikimate kinase [Salinibacterium sp. G-O1]|uniref:shikimate kinase n=1 Tax=Salinibacterium sp. G-O1 TaxID=3046208 RepID=UPI0024B99C79|nr:shikimate kinase [Salinibacterium sp. G-O1]MDJ0335200.1 shikimate kinase [Salinibacterium sp. G-O1]